MKRKSLLFLLLFALLAPWAANAQTRETQTFDFEDQTIPTTWTNDATYPWEVTSARNHTEGGTYSIKSTNEGVNSSTSSIQATFTFAGDGTISFNCLASCESASSYWDYGIFYIDGTQMDRFLNVTDWVSKSYNVELGSHTFKWTFTKDSSAQGNDDCFYVDDIVVDLGVAPACPKPTLGQAEYITEEGASFQWTENGSATQWVLEYSTDANFTNPTQINRNGIPAYAITGLDAATTYYVRVKSVCGGGDESDWSGMVSFKTLCAAEGIPYTYGFEEADPFDCWTVISGNITRISGTPNTGSYRLDFRGTTSNMVALPQFTPATNTLRVEFYTRPESTGGNSGKFAIGYMTDIADASSFVAVETYNSTEMTTSYVKKTVDFTNAPSGATIAMRQFDCSTNWYWYVDDVTVKEIPSCLAPTNLAADATTNSAELSWTANSGEAAWTLYWKKTTDETYTEVANATNPYTLTGLEAATNYQYYVVANCSADEASEASEVFSFVTECDVITVYPYTENFDSYATGVLPVCWSRINKSTNASYNGYPKISSSYAQSSPNSLYFSSYYTESSSTVDPQDQYAILPEMQNLSSMRIKLYARASSTYAYYDATFHVGVMTDPEDETTFTEVATYKPTTTSYTLYTIPFDTYTGNGTYIAIKMDAAAAIEDYTYAYHVVVFDDITVEEIPSCVEPTNLDVTANGQAATLTWVSEVGAYEIAHALEAAADPDENIAGTATEATYTMNDLALGDHYFWVRANCGNSNSVWVGPVSVHIGYCVPAPTSVDNNGISNVTFGIGDGVVNNNTSMGSSVATYLDYTSMTGSLQAGVESTVAITYKTSYTYGTIIWVDFDNSLSFEESEIIYTGTSTNANPTTLNATFVIPATVIPGNYVMRIGGADSNFDGYIAGTSTTAPNPCYTGTYACFQDYTLRVLEAPACMPVSGLTASNATAHTVDLAWTAGGDETAWVVAYKTAEEEEFTEVPASTNPFTLSGLRAETTYSVKVAADCGDTQSTYTNEITITTDVACPAPTALTASDITPYGATVSWTGDATAYNVRYKVVETGEADPIFSDDFENGLDNWTIVDADGDGFNWESHINTGTGNHTTHSGDGVACSASYDNDSGTALTPDNWLISPQVQLGGSVSLWAIGQDASYADEHFAIYVSTTGTNPADFTQVSQEYVATGEYVNYVADLGSYSGMGYVAVRHFNVTDMFMINIDDFAVYGPSDSSEEWTYINNVTGNSTDITGLNPGTAYAWQVQAICNEDEVSTWAASNFTTPSLCEVITTLPVDETTLTETSATLSWTGYSDSYNVRYRTAEDADILLFEDFSNGMGDWTTENLNASSGIYENSWFRFHWTTAPPQYLISPELEGVVDGTVLQFIYAAPSTSWTETFQVGYSSTGTDVDADFTWGEVVETVNNTGEYYTEQVPAGTKYFAIKCTSDDQYYLYVTNFMVYANYVAAGEWQYVNNVTTTSTTLNDLESGTWYEWQVQGADCGDNWIDGEAFQTLSVPSQTIDLREGWNYFSTYIDLSEVDGLAMLEEALGDYGLTIVTFDESAEYLGDGFWLGLDGYQLTNGEMVMIEVTEDCQITLEGAVVDPSTVEITVNPEWTYIGYPVSEEMLIDDAMAGFVPEFGDGIYSVDGATEYLGDWSMGEFTTLVPGQGYMYYSYATEPVTFVYQTASKARKTMAGLKSIMNQSLKVKMVGSCKSVKGDQELRDRK